MTAGGRDRLETLGAGPRAGLGAGGLWQVWTLGGAGPGRRRGA